MAEYKYFSLDCRVKLSRDKYTRTTIVAVFQKRFFHFFWRTVKEINFDVFDYAGLGNKEPVNQKSKEKVEQQPYEYVTISYKRGAVRELWHPSDFDLEKALERHSRKLMLNI